MKTWMSLTVLGALLLFGSGTAAKAETWTLDQAHTNIKFTVKHMMVTNVEGRFTDFEGTVTYDPKQPEKSSVNVTIQTASVNTDNERRDGHLRSADFFETEKYPTMTFVSKKVKKSADGLEVVGDLTLHGVTHEVTLKVEGPTGPVEFMGMTKMAAHATATINRTNYGLTWNKTMEAGGLLVGEEVSIVIDTELDLQK